MSFKEGFDAIEKVKASGQKLSEAVGRIEALELQLHGLREAQAGVEAMLAKAKSTFSTLSESANGLAEQSKYIEVLAQDLPAMVETVVEQKLLAIVAQMEARLSERLRDELKDTRTTLREAFEINSGRNEAQFEATRKEILAEMPRTLFGRKGR